MFIRGPKSSSGRLTIVVVQHSTQPRAALDGRSAVSHKRFLDNQPVAQSLVVALPVIMVHEFPDGLPQGSFSKQDDPLQARFLDSSDEAFRVGVEVRRTWRQFYRFDPVGLNGFQELFCEQRIPVMDQVSLADQET